MSTSVSSVTSHFPSAENGFSTTTSGNVSSGATTVGLNSTSGYTNGEIVVFIIDPDNAKKQTFTGTIDTSGNQVTGVTWTAGTNVAHDAGATVVDYASATHISMITKGILVEHKQTGAHSAITADSVNIAASGALTTDTISEKTAAAGVTIDNMQIKDGLVVGASGKGVNNTSLDTATGALGGAWQTWTPTWTNLTVSGSTVTAKYTQIGKTVKYSVVVVLGGGNAPTGGVTFTLPVTSVSLGTNHPIGWVNYEDAGVASYNGLVRSATTTTGQLIVSNASSTYLTVTGLTAAIPHAWGNGDSINIIGFYEAA